MLEFHWIKAMLFFRQNYDFSNFPFTMVFFSRHLKCRGIFQKYKGKWENTMSKNRP